MIYCYKITNDNMDVTVSKVRILEIPIVEREKKNWSQIKNDITSFWYIPLRGTTVIVVLYQKNILQSYVNHLLIVAKFNVLYIGCTRAEKRISSSTISLCSDTNNHTIIISIHVENDNEDKNIKVVSKCLLQDNEYNSIDIEEVVVRKYNTYTLVKFTQSIWRNLNHHV